MRHAGAEVNREPTAFDVIAAAGNFADGDDRTDEERKMVFETRNILDDESFGVAVTSSACPSASATHGRGVHRRGRCPPRRPAGCWRTSLERILEDVRIRPGRRPGRVFVGRIRGDESHARAFSMWIVSDNLRKGAATNAVQIAEVLVERHLLRRRDSVAA